MTNLKPLAVIAVGMLTVSSAFAEDKACCAGMTGNTTKASCSASFANLDLTAAQKAQMEKLAAECDEGGCNKQTMAKMEKGARKVLNTEQFAAWKSACSAKMSEKAQS